ncbi:Hypothetical predicted protein [Podarcis lilfordi]|uniref:Uncharacterized protein n=1 Tax=Podarcis lilfordi TaxID=74358 RepID=A0AA35NY99_9SAUR|nr:Hypothetical predicted protein [Podarcis lilfordi]
MKPLGEIRGFGLDVHQYADTQLYLSFKSEPVKMMKVLCECLEVVGGWMAANILKLNADKVDVLFGRQEAGRCGELPGPEWGNCAPKGPGAQPGGHFGFAAVNGSAGQFCVQGSCLPAQSGTQAKTLSALRLYCQSSVCSSYLLFGLLQCALRGATCVSGPETATNPECGG